MTSTLADEPAPEFVENVTGAKNVVVACVSGLGMATAEKSLAAGVRENGGGGRHASVAEAAMVKELEWERETGGGA